MQIKTITCHEVYNHGATLQEYALLHFLNSNGHIAETINYKPWYLRSNFSFYQVSPKFNKPLIKQLYIVAKIWNRVTNLKRKKAFDLFSRKYIPTGNVLYRTNDELKENLPDAEVYICGSDQIWNSFFQNGRDPAFYLNFVPNHKLKLSYAASFATDFIADDLKSQIKNNLTQFKAVSVRETSAVHLLNTIGINNAVQVLDPVFLLPSSHWETFTKEINEKFVFVYDFDSNPLIKKMALHLKRHQGYKIYTVNQNVKYADKNFYTDGPEMFLSLVKYACYTITNSFHALTFSIMFNKEVVVVNRNVEINTRMRDLLQLLKINRLISSYEEFLQLEPINYENVNELLGNKIAFSQKFLLDNVKELS